MLKLMRLNDAEYVLLFSGSNKQAIYGSLERVTFAMTEIGIPMTEIEYALLAMSKSGDSVADFGINGTFLFSRKVVA